MPSVSVGVRRNVYVAIASIAFLALTWWGAASRGIIAEEAQPYLTRYPWVLEWRDGAIAAMPPYEDDAPPRPRWVTTSQWPVVAYDGQSRMWPVLVRGHQSAVASYVGIALGPILGGGIAGVRRSTALLGLVVVLATGVAAWRASKRGGPWALAIVASSFGMIAIARTGYGFEVGSRAAMMVAIALLAPRGPPPPRVLLAAACACAIALLSRATIVVALGPAVAVLLLRRDARPTARQTLAFAAVALLGPLVVVAILSALVPLRAGTAPLAGLDLTAIPGRLTEAPRQLVLALAWLGDATSIWGPLARGAMSLEGGLWIPAAIAAVPVAAAAIRWARGVASDAERMLVAALACTVLAGAALYRGRDQFQLALALEPFLALALAAQIASRTRAWAAAAIGAAAMAVRLQTTWTGLSLDAQIANPMLSGASQRAAVARLQELGADGPEVLTTVYNQAGVIEAWTGGTLRPRHAWPLLSASGARAHCALDAAWMELLRTQHPRYVLLTHGANLYESRDVDPTAIRRTLLGVASALRLHVDEEPFATEAGTIGWSLARIDYDDGESPLPGADDVADPTCVIPEGVPSVAELRGLRAGAAVGAFVVESIHTGRGTGEPVAWVVARRGDARVLIELRPDADDPPPPARAGGLAVFYRNAPVTAATPEELAELATAVAARLMP